MKLNESIMKYLNIVNEAVQGRVAPEFNEEDGFDSMTITDAVVVVDDLVKFFTDFAEAVREDAWTYQGADADDLDNIVSLLTEARATLDNMWGLDETLESDESAD